jgi:Rrf2 family protein
MNLSRSAYYAISALLQLSDDPSSPRLSAKDLSNLCKHPQHYLEMVLGDLSTKEILVSTRGPGGGYWLARPTDKISLLEIVEAVDGPIDAGKIPNPVVGGKTVKALTAVSEELATEMRSRLSKVMLSELKPTHPARKS